MIEPVLKFTSSDSLEKSLSWFFFELELLPDEAPLYVVSLYLEKE